MQILTKEQFRAADEYTIYHEPIASIDLMERAARNCVMRIVKLCDEQRIFYIFCGKGNNGGDGLAIARMLIDRGFQTHILVTHYTENFSPDAQINYTRLIESGARIINIHGEKDLESISPHPLAVAIDALFGTGLNKALHGIAANTAHFINQQFKQVISIDCPSGLFIDTANAPEDIIVHSTLTLTFQFPKLSFLLAQNKKAVPYFEILDIGLHPDATQHITSAFTYTTRLEAAALIKHRHKFSHKGTYGHALIIAGSTHMPGAAMLATKACLRSGAGKVTIHSHLHVCNHVISYCPEALLSIDEHSHSIATLPEAGVYHVIAMGPGIGKTTETEQVLKKLIHYHKGAQLVLDADSINLLAENKTWLSFLPPQTILTPHPAEFDRLTEKHDNDFDRVESARQLAVKNNCIVILKGSHTAICFSNGCVAFNSSGNPGLAKAGSGDVLTGILAGLLARGYRAEEAAILGVFLHGYSADLRLKKHSMESICAGDVIEELGKAFLRLEKKK